MATNTQREGPDQPWRLPPRRARGMREHQIKSTRDLFGHERYDARRDTVPRRMPLAMPIRDRTCESGTPHRAVFWVTLRNIHRPYTIVAKSLE